MTLFRSHPCRRQSCEREECSMTPEQSRRDEAARWLSQGRKDLNAARLLATEGFPIGLPQPATSSPPHIRNIRNEFEIIEITARTGDSSPIRPGGTCALPRP